MYLIVLVLLTFVVSACGLNIEKNADGSYRMELRLDEETVQTRIEQSIRDPLIKDFYVELHNGYAKVSGTRENIKTSKLDNMRFRLDLGAANGHMTAVISDVVINDFPLHPDWLQTWNENIARNLEFSGQKNPNNRLITVTVTDEDVLLVWRIEPQKN